MKTRSRHALACTLVLLSNGLSQAAETLSVVPDSARALATAGGRFANLDDASAVRVSPANIADVEEAQLLFNAAVWNGDIQFHSDNGAAVKMENSWIYPASLYGVFPLIPGKVALGLGISTPFGLATEYPKNMDPRLRYALPYESRLLAVDITPALAWKVSENLSVGLGLDVVYSELEIKRAYPWSVWSGSSLTRDGELAFEGSDLGVGGYLGINWTVAKGHRLAFVGRLPITIEYSGELQASGRPGSNAVLNALGTTRSSSFDSEMTFPGSIAVGYGIDLTSRLTLGFDFQWTDNSSHDDIPLNVGNNQVLLGGQNAAQLGWKDSIDLGTGISYALTDAWTLRSGYLFSENSQPDDHYTPAVTVYDRHVIGLGVGWRGKRQSIDLAYAFVYNPERTVSGAAEPAFNGRYKHQWHVISISVTHRF